MTKKNQQYYAAVAVLVVAIALIWFFKAKPAADNNTNSPQNQNNSASSNSPSPAAMDKVWEGTLKVSDTPGKGNLMLVTKERNIYIKTGRDYSNLLNKDVKVTYQGTLQNFALGDIASAEQK